MNETGWPLFRWWLLQYNFFGIEPSAACGAGCLFDAGLVNPDGSPRPVYEVFRSKLRSYSR